MAILRTHDDFIWLDVTERCINDEKTTTEIWLAHELYAVNPTGSEDSFSTSKDRVLQTYEDVTEALKHGRLICIEVGFLPERGNRGQKGEKVDYRDPFRNVSEPEVDLTSFSWDDFTNLK